MINFPLSQGNRIIYTQRSHKNSRMTEQKSFQSSRDKIQPYWRELEWSREGERPGWLLNIPLDKGIFPKGFSSEVTPAQSAAGHGFGRGDKSLRSLQRATGEMSFVKPQGIWGSSAQTRMEQDQAGKGKKRGSRSFCADFKLLVESQGPELSV